ncbi:MAG: glycoside hydrolase family 3 C-terminal domain-containing protein [Bacteroidales bacterium]|nr:glycoside hydrolase family 3 C-terminal domain-containing protein [Bacteroidales bacterium]
MKTKFIRVFRVVLLFTVILSSKAYAQYQYPFQNPALSDNERIDNLISLMTLEEKVNALSTQLGIPRLGIRNCGQVEGLHGLAYGGPSNWGSRNPVPSTIFPQAYGLGETWDVELIRKVAEQEAVENRYYFQSPKYLRGSLVMRAPNADLGRDPRWGRTEECFGEDSWLNARMTVAFIKGLQGDDPKYWRTASLMKHFMANSNEDGRDSTSSDFDERLFREYYGYTFYKGITEGGSRAYMASYNAYNGIPMTVHPILKEVTVREWGNNGIICTDGGALALLFNAHKHYPTMAEAAAACVKAGIGQFLDNYKPFIKEALAKGLVNEKEIDAVLRGNYQVALRLGLLDGKEDNPYSQIGVRDTIDPWTKPEVKQFVREVTAKSVVLLKNTNTLLPLDLTKIKSVAVIGPIADQVLADWYSGTPPYTVTPLQGIRNACGKNVSVTFTDENRMDEAVKAAKSADIAIVVVGNNPIGAINEWKVSPVPSDGKEAVDRKSLTLEQEDLVKLVYQSNPKTIMVLVSSFPFAINWSAENVPAILHITHSSQEMGNGLADVIFGKVNPAGRLVQTWPRSITQLPPMMDYNIRNGRTYMYFRDTPLYPFGYGLSYTSFAYSGMRFSTAVLPANDEVKITVDVKNTGKYSGDEVVQLYVRYLDSKVERPLRQLKGFARVPVNAGETKPVTITLKAADLAYWDEKKHAFRVEPGKVELMLGGSSQDIRVKKTITVVE